ncbi:MAG: lipid A deacylase LpxR family protein [Caulobacterales bacterium]
MRSTLAFLAVMAVAPASYAQERPPSPGLWPDQGSISFVAENDMFADGNDRNYTSGLQLSVLVPFDTAPNWIEGLGERTADLVGLTPQSIGITIGHTLFTPEDIANPTAPPDQHPYAAWAYATISAFGERADRRLDQVDLTVGLVGPAVGGGWLQREWHEVLKGVTPRGWDAQLSNELAFALDYERRYRLSACSTTMPVQCDLVPSFGGALGTLRTEARVGVMARLGGGLRNDYGPPRIRPALAGGGMTDNPAGIRGYFFVGYYGRAVARNLFLDGNTYTESARVDRIPLVGEVQVGTVFQANGLQLSYTFVRRTEEFQTQTEPQQFAAFTIAHSW